MPLPERTIDRWAGAFIDGYTPGDLDAFFTDMYDHTGLELICVWDYRDQYGFGGDSNWYIVTPTGLAETAGSLFNWTLGGCDNPGEETTWIGQDVDLDGVTRVLANHWVMRDQLA